MVNIRRQDDSVQIQVHGPPSIVRNPLFGQAGLTTTWITFLRQLGLKLTEKDGIFVGTVTSKMRNRDGWSAQLNEPIGDFIRKYQRRNKSHKVRLMKEPTPGGSSGRPNAIPMTTAANRVSFGDAPSRQGPSIILSTGRGQGVVTSGQSDTYRRPRYAPGPQRSSVEGPRTAGRYATRSGSLTIGQMEPVAGPSRAAQQSGISGVGICDVRSILKTEPTPKMEPEVDNVPEDLGEGEEEEGAGEEEDSDDNLSGITAASAVNRELAGEGIQVEDVKSFVERRISQFPNSFFLRARKEFHQLQGNNFQWDRNVSRAPWTSYLIQELFKQ